MANQQVSERLNLVREKLKQTEKDIEEVRGYHSVILSSPTTDQSKYSITNSNVIEFNLICYRDRYQRPTGFCYEIYSDEYKENWRRTQR